MKQIIIKLNEEEYEKLMDSIESLEDEGPTHEGWQSKELEDLIEKLRNTIK